MKRAAVLTMLAITLALLVLGGTALAAPPLSLQVNGHATVPTVNAVGDVTGTATVTIHAKSVDVPTLEYYVDSDGQHPYLRSSQVKGAISITVDDPRAHVSFTAKITELRSAHLDVIPWANMIDVVFDPTGLPAAVDETKNLLYISDMAEFGAPDHIWLWFLGMLLNGESPYSPQDVQSGNFIVRGWEGYTP